MGKKTVLIAAGGTGGHLYPAQAIAEELSQKYHVHLIGGELEGNPFFDKTSHPFTNLPCGNPKGKILVRHLVGAKKLLSSFRQSIQVLRNLKPDVVVGFGAIHTLPALLAAKFLKYPIVLHEANCFPGKVNRLLAPYVHVTATHFRETKDWVKGSVCYTGMPIRKMEKKPRRTSADRYRLDPNIFTFLIFGGSQGAQLLNQVVSRSLGRVKKRPIQVLHFTGKGKEVGEVEEIYRSFSIPHYVAEYETAMEYAWSLADFSITRSGASTLAEMEFFSVGGILIPYPFGDNHQEANADAYIIKTGGAKKWLQKNCTEETLAEGIERAFPLLPQWRRNIIQSKKKKSAVSLEAIIENFL